MRARRAARATRIEALLGRLAQALAELRMELLR